MPGSPLGDLLDAWDKRQFSILESMKKKQARKLCQEWTLLKDEEGRTIWPQNGTFKYETLKALRPKLKPTQKPYWYCWAELSKSRDPGELQAATSTFSSPDNEGPKLMAPLLSKAVLG